MTQEPPSHRPEDEASDRAAAWLRSVIPLPYLHTPSSLLLSQNKGNDNPTCAAQYTAGFEALYAPLETRLSLDEKLNLLFSTMRRLFQRTYRESTAAHILQCHLRISSAFFQAILSSLQTPEERTAFATGAFHTLITPGQGTPQHRRTLLRTLIKSALQHFDTATQDWYAQERACLNHALQTTRDQEAADAPVHAWMQAVQHGQIDTVRALLAQGVDVNATFDGLPALELAAIYGHAAIVQLLLESRAAINARTPHGSTALIGAAFNGREWIVHTLLERGAALNLRDNRGRTALHRALESGAGSVARLLLAHGANMAPDNDGVTLLMLAAQTGDAAWLRHCLDAGMEGNARDKDGKTALFYAIEGKHPTLVDAVLAHGAEAHTADAAGATPLIAAARIGEETLVRTFLARGLDVNARDSGGKTALMEAIERAHTAIIPLLLDHGAVLSADYDGYTPLMRAVQHGDAPLVHTLLDKGADANAYDKAGRTALLLAARHGHLDILALLLTHGVGVDAGAVTGDTLPEHGTALLTAARWGQADIVRALLAHGASVTARNLCQRTAAMVALEEGHEAIADMLLAAEQAQSEGRMER